MSSTTVRISKRASRMLREMAEQTGDTMQAILDRAVEAYRRQCFFEEMNAAYTALRNQPESWQLEQKERMEWDAALMDGLDSDE